MSKSIINSNGSHVFTGNTIFADGRVHRCNLCGLAYKHRTSLLNHRKKHTGETQCYYCYKVLSTKQKLQKHVRKVHGALWNTNIVH